MAFDLSDGAVGRSVGSPPSVASPDTVAAEPTDSAASASPNGSATGDPLSNTSPDDKSRRLIPEAGTGTFRVATGRNGPTDAARTYQVELERGLPFDLAEITRTVDSTLADPRGWSAEPRNLLARVDGGADLRVVVASPETADRLCAPLGTEGRLSCRNGANVVLNAWRWENGGPGYLKNIADYRRYVINHEIGHALGYGHVGCPRQGALAPVMLQQTLGLQGCRPNAWPARVDLAH